MIARCNKNLNVKLCILHYFNKIIVGYPVSEVNKNWFFKDTQYLRQMKTFSRRILGIWGKRKLFHVGYSVSGANENFFTSDTQYLGQMKTFSRRILGIWGKRKLFHIGYSVSGGKLFPLWVIIKYFWIFTNRFIISYIIFIGILDEGFIKR